MLLPFKKGSHKATGRVRNASAQGAQMWAYMEWIGGARRTGGESWWSSKQQHSNCVLTPVFSFFSNVSSVQSCFSHLRRQRVSTVYYGSFISICLCLQMPILAAEPLQSQGLCKPVMDILDGKADLSCSFLDTQNIENMQIMCSQSQGFQCCYQCKGGRDRPEEAIKKCAGGPLKKAELKMFNGTMTLNFLDDRGHYNYTFKNGSCSSEEQKMEDAESISMTAVLKTVSVVTALLILLIFTGLRIKRNKLQNWWKNRSSRSQPSPCHRTSQAIQPPYVSVTDTDPEDDDLHSVATDGSADTAADTVDTHDAVPGETSVNPTKDLYPPSAATENTFLTADSESATAYDSEARDSTYCDSYNFASLDARVMWLCCCCLPGC